MNSIDKREQRAELKINSRYSGVGKGDSPRTTYKDFSSAPLWCEHGKMKDKCATCADPVKAKCKCGGTEFSITEKPSHTQHKCVRCKVVYCIQVRRGK